MAKPQVTDEDLLRMHREGLSHRAIGKATGLAHSTVSRRLGWAAARGSTMERRGNEGGQEPPNLTTPVLQTADAAPDVAPTVVREPIQVSVYIKSLWESLRANRVIDGPEADNFSLWVESCILTLCELLGLEVVLVAHEPDGSAFSTTLPRPMPDGSLNVVAG